MTDEAPSNRLSLTHPKIYLNALVMLIVGSFNSIGQKVLLDPDHKNYRHPLFINLGMFYGEFLNYIVFMILCLIRSTFKSINKEIYKKVNDLSDKELILRKLSRNANCIPPGTKQASGVSATALAPDCKPSPCSSFPPQFTRLGKMRSSFSLRFLRCII